MSEQPPRPIALLTDFGTRDWYVGAMKGMILARTPEARIIDLTHDIAPGDIAAGAFALACALGAMPPGTVLCCVVDPGVGTPRRAIAGRIGDWGFAGPDNGLATPLLERAGAGDFDLHAIEAPDWRVESVGATFHGRDLFAPAAARLAAGWAPAWAGRRVTDPVRLAPDTPERRAGGWALRVVWVDRFGNLVTNAARAEWEAEPARRRILIEAGPLRIESIRRTFAEAAPGEPLAYWGSSDRLEIAVNGGSAAAATGLGQGDSVFIREMP